ncbi:cytochrome P450 [Crucibulum laeve]|uniref:Cytochrome P450 n=1 Tax=Crucibulum laeve TaxID=68775 RepID=A0A5C3LFI6_9AGAR|nr:cytochrome P450 [Crucibulum laeve]
MAHEMSLTLERILGSSLSWSLMQEIIVPNHLFIGFGVYILYRIVHRLFLYPYLLSPLRDIPGPPLGNPLWGQSPTIIRSETGIPQREWVKQYGPVVRVVGPIGIERMIFMKPEALHQVLVKDWLIYPRPNFLRNILGLVTGYGLLTVTGNDHKQMRKAMNPAFSIPNLMAQTFMYYTAIDGLIDILNDKVGDQKDGKVIHVYDWMSKATLDIICETAFGYKANSLHNPHNELAESYEKLLSLQSGPNLAKIITIMSIPGGAHLLASNWAYQHRKWFGALGILNSIPILLEAMHNIRRISSGMLAEKLASASTLNISDTDAKRDIMSLLVRARVADVKEAAGKEGGVAGEYRMSDQAMMDQVLTFLGAGHETTASGLTWTLWLLANAPEAQAQLRAEVTPVWKENKHPDYRALKELKWLDSVMQVSFMESLRIMPPVPLTVRKATESDYIDGVYVPKGTLLSIPIRIVNTWKEIWGSDAEEFNPARWLDLPPEYHPTFSMLSFIAGPHACIGKTMSIIEMKAVLGALITNFEFAPAFEGQKAKPAAAITMKPTDGMPLRVTRISRHI